MSIAPSILAQEYFVIVKKNDVESYKFSENDTLTLYNKNGVKRTIKNDDVITVNGKYMLEIKKHKSNALELIDSEGGKLEIFKLPINRGKTTNEHAENTSISDYWNTKIKSDFSLIERKEISRSNQINNHFNILLVFKNGIVFKIEDDNARAWENGKEIDVINQYTIRASTGILTISFDPESLETSWDWK